MTDILNEKGVASLATSIVRQAVKEWKEAMIVLQKIPEDERARETVRDVESFFHSNWYQILREFAPDVIPVDITEKLK